MPTAIAEAAGRAHHAAVANGGASVGWLIGLALIALAGVLIRMLTGRARRRGR